MSDKDRGSIKSERCLSDPSLSHEVGTSSKSGNDAALSHEVGASSNSSDVVESRQILSEQSMNMRLSTSECPEGSTTHFSVPALPPHPPVASSSCELTTMSSQLPIKSEETADCGRPPLSEVLIEPSLVNKKKTSLNPFVKLDSRLPSVTPSLLTQPTVISKQGSTPIATRKVGLSLKIRKRKFVMSPSKAQQEKPVKQVLSKNRDKQAFSFTPPLFTTPSHPHNLTSSHTHTPSLFSPGDRDLLDQYSVTKQTPCRRYIRPYKHL